MHRSRKLALRLVAVLLGVLLTLGVTEIGLRVARWPGPPLRSGRLETHHRSPPSRPDFRDRGNPLATEKRAGVRRIVVVGDSFTWGAGVLAQDAYPDRMQAELDRRASSTETPPRERRRARKKSRETPAIDPTPTPSDPAPTSTPAVAATDSVKSPDSAKSSDPAKAPVEIVNFSRPGWNTPLELGALRRSIDSLAPDVLVLGYCLNDNEPLRRRELAELRRGVFPGEPVSPLSRFLFAHSALYRIVFQRADNLRMRRATTDYYHRLYDEGQASWVATRRALSEMHGLAASRGIPFLMVVFPIFDSQLDHRYHYHALHETVARTANELGIDAVDLLPRYLGIDARRLALDPFLDAHPSELGHRIAATAILEELDARGLLAGAASAGPVPTPSP
jgi:lysophospholipase L1-like esterase